MSISKFIKIFFVVTCFLLLTTNTASAQTERTFYWYKNTLITSTSKPTPDIVGVSGPFVDQMACNQNRNVSLQRYPSLSFGYCFASTKTSLGENKDKPAETKWYLYYSKSGDTSPSRWEFPGLQPCNDKIAEMLLKKDPTIRVADSCTFNEDFTGGIPTPKPLDTDTSYQLLAPLPGLKTFESDPQKQGGACAFGNYLNIMIKLILGIAAVLAMIMIIKGGFEYMGSSLPSEKESGKGTITNAIFGLILALGAYLILYTVNPDLLNFCSIGKPIIVPTTVEEETQ